MVVQLNDLGAILRSAGLSLHSDATERRSTPRIELPFPATAQGRSARRAVRAGDVAGQPERDGIASAVGAAGRAGRNPVHHRLAHHQARAMGRWAGRGGARVGIAGRLAARWRVGIRRRVQAPSLSVCRRDLVPLSQPRCII